MKKAPSLLILTALCLTLSACGEKGPKPFDPAADAKTLTEATGVFTQALTEIEQATACALYGIDETTVTASAVYASPANAEELAIFTFSDEQSAQNGAKALGYRVEDRREELKDYLPGELPKLDQAKVELRGSSVLLVIAADYGPVDAFLEE